MSTPYPFRRGLLAQHVALGSRGPQRLPTEADDAAGKPDDDLTKNADRPRKSGPRYAANASDQPRR
jgi:hypothetical protein